MMSSETSTEAQSLQPWQLFTLAGLIGATIVVFFARGQTPAVVILLSLTIFAAAALGVAALRAFVPLATPHESRTPQIVGGRTRAALEREKALVLRTIKELEFDRAMGKVSETDFAEMSLRLRSRAARLMRQLDAGTGYRDEIEREVIRRVGHMAAPATAAADRHAEPAVVPAAAVPSAAPSSCATCGTGNDADAKFCKNCGASLRSPA